MSEYEPFEGICFTDTLELAEGTQMSMFVEENTERILREKAAQIGGGVLAPQRWRSVRVAGTPIPAHPIDDADERGLCEHTELRLSRHHRSAGACRASGREDGE